MAPVDAGPLGGVGDVFSTFFEECREVESLKLRHPAFLGILEGNASVDLRPSRLGAR